ncbi:MAG: ATP-binding protein [Candidatus Altiarchaeota archaeon]|nr:ATP-binding protein [Candidatus Altiarchaeota archaeon]
MDSVGMVVGSEGSILRILVQSDSVEVGSILKVQDHFCIVSSMGYSEDEKIGSRQRLIAEAEVFGRLEGGRLHKVKKPVRPHERVEFASKEELERLLSVDDKISIGRVYGTEARALLNAGEYDRHIAVLASTGAGKSYTAANLIKEFSLLGLPVLVVDTHGEYQKLLAKLAEKTPLNIVVYTVKYGRQGLEQLKIPVSNLNATDFMHFANLNDNQVYALEVVLNNIVAKKVEEDYDLNDIIKSCDEIIGRAVDDKSSDVHEETAKAVKRRISGLARTFRDVFDLKGTDLSKLVVPYQITIIDASLATQTVRQSVVSYVSKKILQGRISKVQEIGIDTIEHPVLLVVEEAHNYAGDKVTGSCKFQLQRIASEGRKFGVGLCVISQKPSKIDEEILSQCNTGIYMHITNPNDKDHIKKSFESVNEDIVRGLDSLDVGECIITGAMLDIPFLMCTVDRIELKEKKQSKFNFKKQAKVTSGKFGYV